jgi:hypothetical protein
VPEDVLINTRFSVKKNLLQFWLNAAHQMGALGHPVTDHPLGLGIENFGPYFSRSGNEQLDMLCRISYGFAHR